jgi:lycopene cyclase domain-containing protein
MVGILVFQWKPGTYLALELGWAIPPIMLQFGFGADILWKYRRLLFYALVPMTLYLSAADALAISSGTWTIDPAQSLPFRIGGILPIEEFIFFFITNVLCIFGITLVMASETPERFEEIRALLATGGRENSSFPPRINHKIKEKSQSADRLFLRTAAVPAAYAETNKTPVHPRFRTASLPAPKTE